MMKKIIYALMIIAAVAGCSTPAPERETLEHSMKQYNNMLQWQQMNSASLFVASNRINDFIAAAEAARNIRIVDARVRITRFDEQNKEAEARVEYDYYHNKDFRLRTHVDQQHWIFIAEGGKPQWKLKSVLPAFP